MENLNLWTIVSLILLTFSIIFATFWLKIKNKLSKLVTLFKETLDLLVVSIDAIDDNKLTETEIMNIRKEFSDVVKAWKNLNIKE